MLQRRLYLIIGTQSIMPSPTYNAHSLWPFNYYEHCRQQNQQTMIIIYGNEIFWGIRFAKCILAWRILLAALVNIILQCIIIQCAPIFFSALLLQWSCHVLWKLALCKGMFEALCIFCLVDHLPLPITIAQAAYVDSIGAVAWRSVHCASMSTAHNERLQKKL